MSRLMRFLFERIKTAPHVWLLAAALIMPVAVFVPWALFGDSVPRWLLQHIPYKRLWAFVLVLEAMLLGTAVRNWWQTTGVSPDPRRARIRGLWGVLGLAVGIGISAGIVFMVYGSFWERAHQACSRGLHAPTLAERQRLFAHAQPWMERVAFFNEQVFSCQTLREELNALASTHACPRFPPRDVPCRCGIQQWPEDGPREYPVKCAYGDASSGRALMLTTPDWFER